MKLFTTALFAAGLLFFNELASAQTKTDAATQTGNGGKNIVKWNALGLAAKNISFQYERAIGKKISVGLNLGLTPQSGLPLSGTLKNLADDEEIERQIDGIKAGSFSITPEIRFYTGKAVFSGFYIAPYARYTTNSYISDFRYDVDDTEKTINIDGNTKVFTGGLMIGSQHKLGGKFYLNWWMGGGAGSISGNFNGTAQLSPDEVDALRDELNDLDPPLIKIQSEVDGNGATAKVSGTGISARFGLAFGIRF